MIKFLAKATATLGAFVLPAAAMAGFNGSIEFTADEIKTHKAQTQVIAEEASACIKDALAYQKKFFREHGIAGYYGTRSTFGEVKPQPAAQERILRNMGKDPKLLKQMRPTSCVELAFECLGKGFAKGRQEKVWERIFDYTARKNASDGMALQFALQKLGWRVLYWNADPSQNRAWDRSELAADPQNRTKFAGDHAVNYSTSVNRSKYFWTTVDDNQSLRDLSSYKGASSKGPASFLNVPFFVGIAHQGWHVFPGYKGGMIIEAHSTRKIDDEKTVESAPLNPLGGGGPNGAPKGQAYRSGLIAIPVGY